MGKLFDVIERVAEAALHQDWDTIGSHYAIDVEGWSPTYEVRGRDAVVDAVKAQNGSFDVRQEQWLIAETDSTVVVEWTWSIPNPEVPASEITVPGLSYFVFDGEQISRFRQYWDMGPFSST